MELEVKFSFSSETLKAKTCSSQKGWEKITAEIEYEEGRAK